MTNINETNRKPDAQFGDTTHDSVNTDEVYTAEVGDLQATLSNATAGDTVRMRPGRTYDPGSETTVPQDVTLDFNGASIEPSTDYNILFMEPDSAAVDIDIRVDTQSYFSDYIKLQTSRAGKYSAGEDSAVHLEGRIRGATGGGADGTGVHLIDDATTQEETGISIGNTWNLTLVRVATGIHGDLQADADDEPFINGVRADVDLVGCGTGVLHTGNGSFVTTFRGDIQAGAASVVGLENQTTEPTFTWDGIIWDTFGFDNFSLKGPGITNITTNAAWIKNTSDGSSGQTVVDIGGSADGITIIELEGDSDYSFDTASGQLIFNQGSSTIYRQLGTEMRFRGGTDQGYIKYTAEDLSQRTPNAAGEFAVDDGTNTASGDVEIAIGQAVGGAWKTMSGDVI